MTHSSGIVDSDTFVLSIGGLRIAARTTGSGDPVLLLNGMSRPMESWTFFAGALRGRTLIAFDGPGVGASETPMVPYSMPMLSDIAARSWMQSASRERMSSDTPTAAQSPSRWRSAIPPA
ncbi:MAG: hypothetical protein QOD88_4630 [Mycobacterium sp.]|jgi:pimeloyl-ACP methyl ester carboxylesterase|nr:hypothetical protein [Mycobacterium sp.]